MSLVMLCTGHAVKEFTTAEVTAAQANPEQTGDETSEHFHGTDSTSAVSVAGRR